MHSSLANSVNRTLPKEVQKSVTIEILSHLDFKSKTREFDLSVLLIDRYNYSECFLCKILIIYYFYILVYLSYLSTSAV